MRLKHREEITEQDSVYIVETYETNDGEFVVKRLKSEDELPQPEPEPTQLDRIESAINELGAESLLISKVETAIMEGVNGI